MMLLLLLPKELVVKREMLYVARLLRWHRVSVSSMPLEGCNMVVGMMIDKAMAAVTQYTVVMLASAQGDDSGCYQP